MSSGTRILLVVVWAAVGLAACGDGTVGPRDRPTSTTEITTAPVDTGASSPNAEPALNGFGPLQWISDPDERTDDLRPAIEGAAILGVEEPEINGDSALVPMSLWCGGLCGTWPKYRVELIDGSWHVTGTEGPIAIS